MNPRKIRRLLAYTTEASTCKKTLDRTAFLTIQNPMMRHDEPALPMSLEDITYRVDCAVDALFRIITHAVRTNMQPETTQL